MASIENSKPGLRQIEPHIDRSGKVLEGSGVKPQLKFCSSIPVLKEGGRGRQQKIQDIDCFVVVLRSRVLTGAGLKRQLFATLCHGFWLAYYCSAQVLHIPSGKSFRVNLAITLSFGT